VIDVPSLNGLSWAQVRQVARDLVGTAPDEVLIAAARAAIVAPEIARRSFGVFLLGFTSGANPGNLAILRELVAPDPSWEVQEALAQALDAYCAAIGYDAALPTIDAWLADGHPNARRAVTEGLRPWTSKQRRPFAQYPQEAIRRLAALRADPSNYVRHSVGNALRDIKRRFPAEVEAEIATWDLANPLILYTYQRVLRAR
jgi:hypothetical protein